MTFKLKTLCAIGAIALVLPAIALAGVEVGTQVGLTDDEIRANLSEQGYTVEEIEREEDEIEVEVSFNGEELELEISPETGEIVSIEKDD